jgi:hypothetical protein
MIRAISPRYGFPKGEHAPILWHRLYPKVLLHSNFYVGLSALLLTVKYADGLPLKTGLPKY